MWDVKNSLKLNATRCNHYIYGHLVCIGKKKCYSSKDVIIENNRLINLIYINNMINNISLWLRENTVIMTKTHIKVLNIVIIILSIFT